MFELIDKIGMAVPLYLLVFARISAMVLTMPLFGSAVVNVRVRILLAFILTLVITPLLGGQWTYHPAHIILLVFDVLREVMIGLVVGYGAQVVFEALSVAGFFVGFQMGLAIMNVLDPSSQDHSPIVGNFWVMVVLMFFIITNTHHFLIQTLYFNFKIIAPAAASFAGSAGRAIMDSGSLLYDMAVRFAAPMMIFILAFDVAIAFMARVMPQMNIFFVSLPLKISFGIFLLILSLNIFQSMFGFITDQMQTLMMNIVKGI